MTKLPAQTRREGQRRCWCGTGECWAVECDTGCKGVARPSTSLAIIQAMSNCPDHFPRLLLWVVLSHSMDGRSQCPLASCAGSVGSQGRRKRPVQDQGRELDCILLAWVLGQGPSELTSLHRGQFTQIFTLYINPKKIRLTVLQTASGTFFRCYLL